MDSRFIVHVEETRVDDSSFHLLLKWKSFILHYLSVIFKRSTDFGKFNNVSPSVFVSQLQVRRVKSFDTGEGPVSATRAGEIFARLYRVVWLLIK